MTRHIFIVFLTSLLLLYGCESDTTTSTSGGVITVASISPSEGREGTVVTITGTNFGSDRSAIAVLFGNASCLATIDAIVEGNQIITRVPTTSLEGKIMVSVLKNSTTADIPFKAYNAVVARWKSEGQTQVAPGLWDSLKVRKVEATFDVNGSYTISRTDSAGAVTTFTGTYSKGAPTTTRIFPDTLRQTSPTVATSIGIYRVVNDTLSLEVAQTTPSIGWTAPTTALGFGSTKVNNVTQGVRWVQKFIIQR
jgi:hypothetical protein